MAGATLSGERERVWQEEHLLRYHEVDAQLEMQGPWVLHLFQEAAGNHAGSIGMRLEELLRENRSWFLTRISVSIAAPLKLGEQARIWTWASERGGGARAIRDFALVDEAGRAQVTGSSLWLLVDLATKRPLRLPEAVLQLRRTAPVPMENQLEGELFETFSPDSVLQVPVVWSDCDQNQHVTNSAYLRWALDSLPVSFLRGHRLAGFSIQFLREMQLAETPGEAMVAVWRKEAGPLTQWMILVDGGGNPLAKVRTEWEPRA